MEMFSPEFSAYWLIKPERAGEKHASEHCAVETLSPSQQLALEELAERVNAARSVV